MALTYSVPIKTGSRLFPFSSWLNPQFIRINSSHHLPSVSKQFFLFFHVFKSCYAYFRKHKRWKATLNISIRIETHKTQILIPHVAGFDSIHTWNGQYSLNEISMYMELIYLVNTDSRFQVHLIDSSLSLLWFFLHLNCQNTILLETVKAPILLKKGLPSSLLHNCKMFLL